MATASSKTARRQRPLLSNRACSEGDLPARVKSSGPGRLVFCMDTETLPQLDEKTEEKVKEAFERNWNVIVWNDPVNLMSYVVFVFMKVLAFTKEKATRHMLEVH